jgi:hypothetical protein
VDPITLPVADIKAAVPPQDAQAEIDYSIGALVQINIFRLNINQNPVAVLTHGSYRVLDDGVTGEYSPTKITQTIPDLYTWAATPLVMPDGSGITPPTPDEIASALQTLTNAGICAGIIVRAAKAAQQGG